MPSSLLYAERTSPRTTLSSLIRRSRSPYNDVRRIWFARMSTDISSKSHAARPRVRRARFAVSLTASFPRMPARSSRRST